MPSSAGERGRSPRRRRPAGSPLRSLRVPSPDLRFLRSRPIAIRFVLEVVPGELPFLDQCHDHRRDTGDLDRPLRLVEAVQPLVRLVVVAADLRVDADTCPLVLDDRAGETLGFDRSVDPPRGNTLVTLLRSEEHTSEP